MAKTPRKGTADRYEERREAGPFPDDDSLVVVCHSCRFGRALWRDAALEARGYCPVCRARLKIHGTEGYLMLLMRGYRLLRGPLQRKPLAKQKRKRGPGSLSRANRRFLEGLGRNR